MKCKICKKRETTDLHHKDCNHKNNKPRNLQRICTICHAKIHNIEPRISELKRRVIYFNKVQKARITISNSIKAFNRIELICPEELENALEILKKIEAKFEKEIKNYVIKNSDRLSDWLLSIKGINYILTAKILGEINWKTTKSVASLWSYAGLSPDSKKQKGKKENYNHRLKFYCYQVADGFIKKRTLKYREVYDREKEKQLSKVKRGHAHKRAIRKMEKVFLKDLFNKARRETKNVVSS